MSFQEEEDEPTQKLLEDFGTHRPVSAALAQLALANDVEARARRNPQHKLPANWPRDAIDCQYCNKRHARNICCSSYFNETHEGELELVFWSFNGKTWSEKLGFGATTVDEADELRLKFDKELGFDYAKCHENWDDAFRWTCCGQPGGSVSGCDQHGSRGWRCSCDFCNGRQLYLMPPEIHNRFLLFRALYPERTVWDSCRFVPWTPEVHKRFPRSFKRAVRVLVTCLGAPTAPEFTRALPVTSVQNIVYFMALFEVGVRSCRLCDKTDGKLLVCSRCKSVRYCSRDCQRLHWKAHKNDCAADM